MKMENNSESTVRYYVPAGERVALRTFADLKREYPWVTEEDAPQPPYRVMTLAEFEEYCRSGIVPEKTVTTNDETWKYAEE